MQADHNVTWPPCLQMTASESTAPVTIYRKDYAPYPYKFEKVRQLTPGAPMDSSKGQCRALRR